MATATHAPPASGTAAPLPSSGSSATAGMIAKSWNSSTEKALRPDWLASKPRSAIIGSAIAVEDSASPKPITTAAGPGSPSSQTPSPAITAAVNPTCAPPSPSTDLRMTHSRAGRSSSPIRNSSMTTPSSEACAIASTLVTSPSPAGPTAKPAAR